MEDVGFDPAGAEAMFALAAVPMTMLARHGDGSVEILAANPAAAELKGWDPVEVRGRRITELYPADHAARTAGFVARLEGPGSVVDYRVELEGLAGRRAYEVRLIGLGEHDGVFVAVSMSHDVTRCEAAEAALEETQRLGRIGHFSWNVATEELTWTDQMYELFGLPVGTPLASPEVAFSAIDDPNGLQDRIAAALATDGSYDAEFAFTRPDGERRIAVARCRAVFGADGAMIRVTGTTQDVTEQRAAERHAVSLARARAKQAQALELNDDVLQGLATVRVALMQEEHDFAIEVLDRTLEAARDIISDLLRDHLGTGPIPGDLVRARSSGPERKR